MRIHIAEALERRELKRVLDEQRKLERAEKYYRELNEFERRSNDPEAKAFIKF